MKKPKTEFSGIDVWAHCINCGKMSHLDEDGRCKVCVDSGWLGETGVDC